MNREPPKIDARTSDDLYNDFVSRASLYIPEWNYNNSQDVGAALVRLYLEMFEQVQVRLNQMLQKSFVTFLDDLGISLLPPQSARTWVSFTLVPGAPDNAIVVEGSEIAGKGVNSEGKEQEAPFQTLRDIAVSPSTLIHLVSVNALEDSIYRFSFDTKNLGEIVPFQGENLQEHSIYIGHSDFFNLAKNAQINVLFSLTSGAQKDMTNWLVWEFFNGIDWTNLGKVSYDSTNGLTLNGKMTITRGFDGLIIPQSINKIKNRWIRCRALNRLTALEPVSLPEIEAIKLSIQSDPDYRNEPDLLFHNNNPLDVGITAVALKGIDVGRFWIDDFEIKAGATDDEDYVEKLTLQFTNVFTEPPLKEDDVIEFESGVIGIVESVTKSAKNSSQTNQTGSFYDVIFKDIIVYLKFLKRFMSVKLLTAIRKYSECNSIRLQLNDKSNLLNDRLVYLDFPGSSLPVIYEYTDKFIETDKTIVNIRVKKYSQENIKKNCLEGELIYIVPHIMPFSKEPHTEDVFYIANDEALSKKNAMITIKFTYKLNEFYKGTKIPGVLIAWEYWNGDTKTWRKLNVIDQTNGFVNYSNEYQDKKIEQPWVQNNVQFQCPSNIAKTKVNGEENYWIRALIIDGDFGKSFSLEPNTIKMLKYNGDSVLDEITKQPVTITFMQSVPKHINYPIINSIVISYETALEYPQNCYSLNNAGYIDLTARIQQKNWPFQPFEILPEKKNALFFGFDKQLYGGPLRILFNLREEFTGLVKEKVAWFYWNGLQWNELIVNDMTNGLRINGTIEFFGKRDFTRKELFNISCFWLKAIPVNNTFPESLAFNGIYFNAVDAIQSSLIKDEPLGASSGLANQNFTTLQFPIIEQSVWVREPSLPDDESLKKIIAVEGKDAYTVVQDKGPWDGEVWIRWHEVEDFDATTPDDRSYTIDKRTGVVKFGNGKNCMIPPKGTSNLRITYRFGGGIFGNVVQGSVSVLKSTISYFNSVKNPFPAEGGTESEKVNQALIRGSESLQHRNHAVTANDFERIALQVSRAVARVCCLPQIDDNGMHNPGWISLLIVPVTAKRPPVLKQELIAIVKDGVEKVCIGTLASEQRLSIRSPIYVIVRVEAVVVPTNSDHAATVEKNILEILNRYLDPITGGDSSTGWEFGETVCFSKIISIIESVDNVDHTVSCKMYADSRLYTDDIRIPFDALVVSGSHTIDLVLSEPTDNDVKDQIYLECD